jgi:hypothetical protein
VYACVFGVCVAACAAQAARWQAGAVHSRPPAHLNVTHQCLQPTSDAATAHAVPRKAPAAGAASHALCYHTACPAARSPWGFKTGPPAVRQGSWGRRLRAWHNAVRRGATPAPPPASPCHQANRWRHSRATCSNACQKHSLVTGTTHRVCGGALQGRTAGVSHRTFFVYAASAHPPTTPSHSPSTARSKTRSCDTGLCLQMGQSCTTLARQRWWPGVLPGATAPNCCAHTGHSQTWSSTHVCLCACLCCVPGAATAAPTSPTTAATCSLRLASPMSAAAKAAQPHVPHNSWPGQPQPGGHAHTAQVGCCLPAT